MSQAQNQAGRYRHGAATGSCDLDDVQGIIERIVAVSVMALTGREADREPRKSISARRA
jgi:hypothetical protein